MLGKDEMKKMGPSILIALAKKKGMSGKEDSEDEGSEDMDMREHLEEIASDLIQAVKDEDSVAVADLLKEAFDCCGMSDSHSEDKY